MSEPHCTMRAVNVNLGPAIVTMSKNSYEPQGLAHKVRIKPSSSTVWSCPAKGYHAQHNVQLTLSGCFPTSPALLARGSLLLCILTSFSRKKILQSSSTKTKRKTKTTHHIPALSLTLPTACTQINGLLYNTRLL